MYLLTRTSWAASRALPTSVLPISSRVLARHVSLCWAPGFVLLYRWMWSHCGQPSVKPCCLRSASVILKRRAGTGGATSTGSPGPCAGSWNRTSGAARSRCDHGVAVICDNISGHHLFGMGTRFNDLAVVIPPSLVAMT